MSHHDRQAKSAGLLVTNTNKGDLRASPSLAGRHPVMQIKAVLSKYRRLAFACQAILRITPLLVFFTNKRTHVQPYRCINGIVVLSSDELSTVSMRLLFNTHQYLYAEYPTRIFRLPYKRPKTAKKEKNAGENII